MLNKNILLSLSIFINLIIILGFASIAHAADIPKAEVKAAVKTDGAEGLGVIVVWNISETGEYGFRLEKEGVKGKEIAAIFNPVDEGDEYQDNSGFYFDEAVVPNDTYTYYVTTFDRGGEESAAGKVTIVATPGGCASEISTFNGKEANGTVTLTWNEVCNAKEYKVFRDGKEIGKTDKTSYEDKNVAKGDHEYTIEAYAEKTSARSLIIGQAYAADPLTRKSIRVTVTGGPTSGPGRGPGDPEPSCDSKVNTEFGWVCDVAEYVSKILNYIVGIAGALALIMMIYAGYLYMTSQGDQEKIKLAKEIIIGVIVGIVLLFTTGLILRSIGAI